MYRGLSDLFVLGKWICSACYISPWTRFQSKASPFQQNTMQNSLRELYFVYPRWRMRPCLLINSKRKTIIGHKYCGSYASVIHSCVVHSSLKIVFIYLSLRKLRVLRELISRWANKPMHIFMQNSRVLSLRFQPNPGGVYNPQTL
jgi:hypothetical protein